MSNPAQAPISPRRHSAIDHDNLDQTKDRGWKKAFLTIAVGQALSIVGSSAAQFSLIWWLASETSSPLMMSLAGLLAFLPQLLLGPFAGVWIDRLSRKMVIICADLFMGLVAAVFAASFYIWDPPYWSACVVLGVRAIGGVFHAPAIQAAVPMLVPREELVRANGWNQFLQSGAYIVGPVLGAAMYAALPLPVILLSDLAGAVIASASVAIVRIPEIQRGIQTRPGFLAEIREGIAAYLVDRNLCIVTLAAAVSMVFFMPLASFYPLMTSDYFRATEWHASFIQIVYSVGMMAGAMAVGSLGAIRNKLGVVHLGLVVLGVVSLLCGLLPRNTTGFWAFAGSCLAMGASANLYSIPYVAYLQETIPREAQGRAFSLMGSLMSVTMPLGLLIAGPTAERYGVTLWFIVAGIAVLMATAASAAVTRSGRRHPRRGRLYDHQEGDRR